MGVNINLGKNKKLLEQCQTLKEYAIYVKKVRTYAKSMKVEEAVDRAVTECINEGILREFLLQNRKEAVEMSIFEYDEEAVFEVVRKDEYEKGIQEGEKQFALLTERLLEAGRTQACCVLHRIKNIASCYIKSIRFHKEEEHQWKHGFMK